MSEHLENLRRCLERMSNLLEVGNDDHSDMIDLVAHMQNHLDLYKKEIGVNCE